VPRLAIVISAVGSIESLEGTLVSVLENRPADCEIVVALNRAYADPYELKDEVRFIEPARSLSTVAAINRALANVRAPFVHVLASGCRVGEGWAETALARFGDRRLAAIAPLVWDAERCDRIFAAGAGYRASGRRYLVGRGQSQLDADAPQTIVGPCLFAAFYRKAALDFVGGLSTRLGPRQADADLALVLKHAGFTAVSEPRSQVWATADADPPAGAYHQALFDERLFWRNLPDTGKAAALAAHAAGAMIELARAFPRPQVLAQFLGRLRASGELIGYARHRRALAELASRTMGPAVIGEHMRIDRMHDAPVRSEAATRVFR
jgi:hypothetical protein